MRKYHAENPEYSMYGSAQARAKAKGISFELTREDIKAVYHEVCPIFGTPLRRNLRGNANPDSPTLDRIDPARGYIPGNIQVISNRANRMKSDATPEELLQFAAWIQVTYGAVKGGG
jgi:hypothetical protein